MSSSYSNKSDVQSRAEQDHESEQIIDGRFNSGVGRNIPAVGGRRVAKAPPGPRTTLEMLRSNENIVKSGDSHGQARSTTSDLPEPTTTVAADSENITIEGKK